MKNLKFQFRSMCFALHLVMNLLGSIMCSITSESTCRILTEQSDPIEGQSNVMMCIGKPSSNNDVVWYRQNVNTQIQQVINSEISVPRHSVQLVLDTNSEAINSKLIINPVDREDSQYKYFCRLEDRNDDYLESKKSQMSIKNVPREQYPQCRIPEKSYQEGQSVIISCRTEYLLNTVMLNLTKGNKIIQHLEAKHNGNEKTLEYSFSVTDLDNSDRFMCMQISLNNPTVTKNCTFPPLNVNYAPRVRISDSGRQQVQFGTEALLVCTADSNPMPVEVQWSSSPVEYEHTVETNGLVYRIKADSLSLNGTVITCTARNAVGIGTNNYTLLIVDNNKKTNEETKTNVLANQNLSNLHPGLTDDSEIKLLTIAGATLFLSAFLIFVLFCYLRQRHTLYMHSRYIAQPEVYFEPKDSVRTQPPSSDGSYWGRNVGIQVPSDPDKDSEYAEIEEARKSGSNKSV